ncbi:MAG: hypothetical protein GXO60_02825 [Epsilonproteobacteria bacterium]|nr:hypothetical protein [Campylobacterota bacterium]
MKIFTKKLQLIYNKLFENDLDKFTKAFIDDNKFNIDKFDTNNKQKAYEQFFFNRKIVLRRWLRDGIKCTNDFQKSFNYYKISKYMYKGEPLFKLDDFKNSSNLLEFEKRIDDYLIEKKRVHSPIDYRYIYLYSDNKKDIYYYEIVEWKKGVGLDMKIELSLNQESIKGSVSLLDNGELFITINLTQTKQYLLFHDSNDNYTNYTVGICMGFSPKDNKVPRAKKVILSKEILDTKRLDLHFILNSIEILPAIENRVNKNIDELDHNLLIKYTQRLKRYYLFFQELIKNRFNKSFYYRLALKEFNSFKNLFEKVIKGNSYFVYNYQRAFYEMIKTLENIKNIPLYVVQELTPNHYLVQSGYQEMKIQNRLYNLKDYGIDINLIVVIESHIDKEVELAIKIMIEKGINVKIVEKAKIIHQVNSIDFAFINRGDKNDFVLADPLRDSKDVYKIFTNKVEMEEYFSDYYKILNRSYDFK